MGLPSSNTSSQRLAGRVEQNSPAPLLAYLELTKPRLLPMVLFTGLPVLAFAASGWPSPARGFLTLLGVALAAASANALNAYVERETDALMERTRERPLPAGRISPRAAVIFGVALGVISTLLLGAIGGGVAAALCVASILFYVLVYTVWLKPRTAWNTVVGAAAGAAAPILTDAAVNGHVGIVGLTFFAIVFFWQPPHVWAIALYRKAEYEAAGVKMLPSVIGDDATRRRMLLYTVGLLPVSLLPFFLGMLGSVYLGVALAANAWFIAASVRVLRERTDEAARRMFHVSLGYLFALFLTINVELIARSL